MMQNERIIMHHVKVGIIAGCGRVDRVKEMMMAMMNGVGGEGHRRDVVAVDNRSLRDIVMQLMK